MSSLRFSDSWVAKYALAWGHKKIHFSKYMSSDRVDKRVQWVVLQLHNFWCFLQCCDPGLNILYQHHHKQSHNLLHLYVCRSYVRDTDNVVKHIFQDHHQLSSLQSHNRKNIDEQWWRRCNIEMWLNHKLSISWWIKPSSWCNIDVLGHKVWQFWTTFILILLNVNAQHGIAALALWRPRHCYRCVTVYGFMFYA